MHIITLKKQLQGTFLGSNKSQIFHRKCLELFSGAKVFNELCLYVFNRVTREHRENLAKLAKQFTNKAKESLRKVRTNAVNQAKRSKDTVSEDTIKLIEKQVKDGAWFMVSCSCSFLHWL